MDQASYADVSTTRWCGACGLGNDADAETCTDCNFSLHCSACTFPRELDLSGMCKSCRAGVAKQEAEDANPHEREIECARCRGEGVIYADCAEHPCPRCFASGSIGLTSPFLLVDARSTRAALDLARAFTATETFEGLKLPAGVEPMLRGRDQSVRGIWVRQSFAGFLLPGDAIDPTLFAVLYRFAKAWIAEVNESGVGEVLASVRRSA